jgi:ribosomal protein L27
MAVGFPVKDDYATGDVLTAANMNDFAGTLNTVAAPLGSAAGKNKLINGNFDIWQRGTTFTSAANVSYNADRWLIARTATDVNCTVSQDTSVPNVNSEYSLKFTQVTTNATSVVGYLARQLIEQSNILPLLGKTCVISFWYRSNKTGNHGIRIDGTQNTGGTNQATTFAVNAADVWEYKTLTVTAFSAVSASSASPTSAGGFIDIGFRVGSNGFTTVNANDYFQLSQVQLEVGSVATAFQTATGTIQGELASAQRYYWRSTANDVFTFFNMGVATTTTRSDHFFQFPVRMRVKPTAIESANLLVSDGAGGNFTATALILTQGNTDGFGVHQTGSTGMTQFRPMFLEANNTTAAYVAFSAEL